MWSARLLVPAIATLIMVAVDLRGGLVDFAGFRSWEAIRATFILLCFKLSSGDVRDWCAACLGWQ